MAERSRPGSPSARRGGAGDGGRAGGGEAGAAGAGKAAGAGQVVALRGGRCPICGRPAAVPTKPFCSRRCADQDLAQWLAGGYRIPVEPDLDEDGGGATEAPPRGPDGDDDGR